MIEPKKWNILYIVCHDLGRHLGCYGAGVTSPHLDAFAEQGHCFTKAFCSSAVCSPSRGCAMTGLPAHQNGVMGLTHFGWRFAPGIRTVVDEMNDGGYDTIHCGLSHEGEEGEHRYGLDFENSWRSRTSENAVDDCLAILRTRQGNDKPFYMNVGFQDVHSCTWKADDARSNPTSRLNYIYGGATPDEEVFVPEDIPNNPSHRDMLSRLQANIKHMDHHFGRLIKGLKKYGYEDNTLVIFTTDHGLHIPRGKGTLYDRGTEITLLARLPSAISTTPSTQACLIQNIDVMPTLLEAASLPIPEYLVGKSFWPAMTGDHYQPHSHIVTEWNYGGSVEDFDPVRAVRTNDYLYIRNFGDRRHYCLPTPEIPADYDWYKREGLPQFGIGHWCDPERRRADEELYDCRSDTYQWYDKINDAQYGTARAHCASLLQKYMEETDDYLPDGTPPFQPTAGNGICIEE